MYIISKLTNRGKTGWEVVEDSFTDHAAVVDEMLSMSEIDDNFNQLFRLTDGEDEIAFAFNGAMLMPVHDNPMDWTFDDNDDSDLNIILF